MPFAVVQSTKERLWTSLRNLTIGTGGKHSDIPIMLSPIYAPISEEPPNTKTEDARPTFSLNPDCKLPLELWWTIIDEFQHDWLALFACSVVCRSWRARTQIYLPQGYRRTVELYSQRDVASLSRFARVRKLQARTVQIHGSRHSGSIAHLGTFAAMLSGQLRHLNELHVMYGAWQTATVDTCSLFRCLSTYSTIRHLRLCGVTLPSTTSLLRLLYSLPRLRSFDCVDVSTTDRNYGNRASAHSARLCKIEAFVLDCSDVDDIFDLFAAASLAEYSGTVELGIHSARDVEDGERTHFARFTRSLTSVSRLTIVLRDADMSDEALGEPRLNFCT
ncbi:uncharacterized protein B0H18DRAFT_663794 [Fomitopsis serialis]|uniref:uncharacterized protein n=1 Tax=Fomitopsis serialis TaxID=139415 RepID=UPI002007EE5B|nr:uncharacterized protein B0H18DRAFT_663794 [Neoantrodia serialis]KAH9918676.1 hypothetical protein B0H18DRAFT_663794 [Neoantrodia serialis]